MRDHFSEKATRVMEAAQREAVQRGHRLLCTEHVLLGLLAEETSAGGAALRHLGVAPTEIEAQLQSLIGPTTNPLPSGSPVAETSLVREAIRHGYEEALKGGSPTVHTEHLLLGLMEAKEGLAAQTLTTLGVDLAAARAEIERVLALTPSE